MKNDVVVIVIGGGFAGIMAARRAQAEGARVILIDRGSIGMGTNSALANGVFSSPTSLYSSEEYIKDTLEIGRMINDKALVTLVGQNAFNSIEYLNSLGITVVESSKIYYVVKSPRPEVLPGVVLMKALAEMIKHQDSISIMTGFYVSEILSRGGLAYGIRGFNKVGQEMQISASAIVLATGGAGAIYSRNDNQRNMMGQGYYLSSLAGLNLWDMEFVQFIPIVIAEPHLPSILLNSPFPEEVKLINAQGEDVLKKYDIDNLNYAVRNRRDELSILLFNESQVNTVFIDYQNVPSSSWDVHPLSLLKKIKFDFRAKPLAISPGAHFFMGGVKTDLSGHTSLPGLFACGELAWGLHGANRRGGNALTECVVLGEVAGKSAAQYALKNPSDFTIKEGNNTYITHKSSPVNQLTELRGKIRNIAWNYAGVVRSESALKKGLLELQEIHKQLGSISVKDIQHHIVKEDLKSASFVLRNIITASIGRCESRGSFYRSDYPKEDNENWLKNSCLQYDKMKDEFILSHYPIQ